jgi:hypothetical protein
MVAKALAGVAVDVLAVDGLLGEIKGEFRSEQDSSAEEVEVVSCLFVGC